MTVSNDRLRDVMGAREYRFFPTIGSTQDEALAWIRAGAPSGAVVVADEQTRGRGRQGRVWQTPPGVALAVSAILHPPPHALPQVTMLGAMAVVALLDELEVAEVDIKWPNDVRVRGRKVSGVLPEAVWEGDHLRGAALGIGINVRVNFAGTPLADTAVSLETAVNAALDRAELLAALLRHLDRWAAYLGTDTLAAEWRSRLGMLGQSVVIHTETAALHGTAEAVEADGTLLLRDASGTLHRVLAGDVAFP